MAKPLRGECEIELGGEKFTLRLALGQIEELEARLNVGFIELAQRFTTGQARVGDAIEVIRQGFAGAGIKKSDAQIKALVERTGLGFIASAANLVYAVFPAAEGNAGAADEANQPNG